jgi:hypothetical protein
MCYSNITNNATHYINVNSGDTLTITYCAAIAFNPSIDRALLLYDLPSYGMLQVGAFEAAVCISCK